jgi:hypothetical protein
MKKKLFKNKFLSVALALALTAGLSFSAKAYAGTAGVVNSFNVSYGYTHSYYPNGQGTADLNNYNLSLEGAPFPIPVWGQVNFSKNFSAGNKSADIGTENYNNEFYGAKVGYAFSVNRNLTIIPNVGYEYVTDELNGTDNSYGICNGISCGINFNETDHLNQILLGAKVYYTPPVANLWIEGQAYYQNSIGSKFNEGIGGNNGYPYMNYSGTLDNGSGFEIGAKVGYAALKTQYAIFSPFVGVNYESIGVDNTNIGILGVDLGVKTSF